MVGKAMHSHVNAFWTRQATALSIQPKDILNGNVLAISSCHCIMEKKTRGKTRGHLVPSVSQYSIADPIDSRRQLPRLRALPRPIPVGQVRHLVDLEIAHNQVDAIVTLPIQYQ